MEDENDFFGPANTSYEEDPAADDMRTGMVLQLDEETINSVIMQREPVEDEDEDNLIDFNALDQVLDA